MRRQLSRKDEMKSYRSYILVIASVVIFLSCNSKQNKPHNQTYNSIGLELDSLHLELEAIKEKTIIPGFSVAVIHDDSTIYRRGFGQSDILNNNNFTPETIHTIASISKTFIGVSIMKLVELGKLNLDDPINEILPFKIYSPHYPGTPITVRHLVTHTSSLNDDFDDGEKRPSQLIESSIYAKNEIPQSLAQTIYYYDGVKLELEDFMKEAFTPDGKWYAESNFSQFRPGDKYEYSNEGSNLAALIVEVIAGVPFHQFTRENIFEPLQMNNTSWFYGSLDSTFSKVYVLENVDLVSELYEFPRHSESNYPCGDLKSSMIDLTKYLAEIGRGYNGEGTILNSESYKTLLSPQLGREKFEDIDEGPLNDEYNVGVFWAISKPGLVLHKGGSIGVYSILYFDPENNMGAIAYCNLAHQDFGKIVSVIRKYQTKMALKLKQ